MLAGIDFWRACVQRVWRSRERLEKGKGKCLRRVSGKPPRFRAVRMCAVGGKRQGVFGEEDRCFWWHTMRASEGCFRQARQERWLSG